MLQVYSVVIQFLKVTLHLELLKHIGYILRVVQYILIASFIHSLSLFIPYPSLPLLPPSPHW